MKAITLKDNGTIESLTFAEIATPVVQPDEVLIKVKAIGINPVDAYVRQSAAGLKWVLGAASTAESVILGWDISGTIAEVGGEVTEFRKGDDVFGMVRFPGHGKAYAEYVAAPASHLALKPTNISHDEAAAATLAALTAWQALVTYAKIQKGDKVLIHAAAGGVGHYAVQIAKHFGAHVIGTASATNKEFVLSLGANEFIDYSKEKFEEIVYNADIVLDSQQGDHIFRSLQTLKKGGRLISIKAFIEGEIAEKVKEKEVLAVRMMVASNGNDVKQIAGLLEKGVIKSYVSQKFPFNELPKAHQQIETGKTRGKIVVTL